MRKLPRPVRPSIGKRKFNQLSGLVFARDGFTCRVCGANEGDPSVFHTARRVVLNRGYIARRPRSAMNILDNLRTECTDCFEGFRSVPLPRFVNLATLISMVDNAAFEDQWSIFNQLRQKFPDEV